MASSASTSSDRPSTCGFAGGPPGIRTPNLRIKSPVRTCWSEGGVGSELRVCVSVVPIVSQCFPFLHGDETGREPPIDCHRNQTPDLSSPSVDVAP